MVARCGLNLFIFINFHEPCANKKIIIMKYKMKKKIGCFFIHSTPIKHNNKTPFMKNPKIKMWQQKMLNF
jgi:hypothetical protein